MSFRIVLKNEKQSSYRQIGWLILFLHFFFFNFYLFRSGAVLPVVAGIVITALALALQLTAVQKRTGRIPMAAWFVLLAAVWIWLPVYWMAVLMLLLAAMDWLATRPLQIDFSKEQIRLSSFPPKKIEWAALSQVILKDRILTLDFKNDHLLQAEIAPESYGLDEAAFNAFCRQYI